MFDPAGAHLGTITHPATRTTNLAWGGDGWRTLFFTTIVAVVLFTPFLPRVFLAPLPSIFGIQFQIDRASLRIAVFLDATVPMAHANGQGLVLVRCRIDPKVKARDLELQDSVVDEGTHASRYIYTVSRSTPLGPDELAPLR